MTEIKNMLEFEPRYWADTTLHWMVLKPKKGRKIYSKIAIEKIQLPKDIPIDEETLKASREQYETTHEMIPVYLSFDFKLIGGFEQFILAKELGKKRIPFIRKNRMNRAEKADFLKTIHHHEIGNKKYFIKDIKGNKIFVTLKQYKRFLELLKIARQLKYFVMVFPDLSFAVKSDNKYIIGSPDKGAKYKTTYTRLKNILEKND